MARNEKIRKEFSAEDRFMEPDFSPNKKNVLERQAEIWMTPELKEAARALQQAWEISHDEQMGALHIQDVNLKFASFEVRATFLKSLENLAKIMNPNFPRTFPLPKPIASQSSNLDEVWLNFWYKYFLPDAFDTVMQDVAGTERSTIPAPSDIPALAKACLAAYGSGFIRMDLVVYEGVDRSVVDSLTESLRLAQTRLIKFLQQLKSCLADPKVHRVVILGADRFEVDGVPKEFTGAALRALLALALLRTRSEFRLEDFARFYHGGDTSDARTDFDNAMKALKKELPNIAAQTPSQNHRSILGIKFLVDIRDDAMVKRLAGFYKK